MLRIAVVAGVTEGAGKMNLAFGVLWTHKGQPVQVANWILPFVAAQGSPAHSGHIVGKPSRTAELLTAGLDLDAIIDGIFRVRTWIPAQQLQRSLAVDYPLPSSADGP
jgi:hypothetical protein